MAQKRIIAGSNHREGTPASWTGALLDRLTHRVHILEADGESYRLKAGKNKREPKGGNSKKDGA